MVSYRPDGKIIAEPENVEELLLRNIPVQQILVTQLTPEIIEFNQFAETLLLKSNDDDKYTWNLEWNIPTKYKTLDVREYFNQFKTGDDRVDTRIDNELTQVYRRNLVDLFRVIIYIVDTLKEKAQVWGVGRGSSCASYLLFLIGLHLVDPLKYNISYSEFFHD
jgi:DNA polymerase III alpha subunit